MALSDEIKKKIESLGKSALHIVGTPTHGFSRFGGSPSVPLNFEWPVRDGKPLVFLLQLKLSDINKDGYLSNLPMSGLLYVFYDAEEQTWGFDPKDEGSWRVMFFEETSVLETQRPPNGLDTQYKEKYVYAKPVVTYPPLEYDCIGELLDNDEEYDEYQEIQSSAYGDEPLHHLGGYCDPVQNADMELECQLVSNGLYCGDETGYKDKRRKELEAGRAEWTLLLQIDTDDDTEMMWVDAGTLYFWIRESDLKAKNFDKVWMILQCC